MNAIIKSEGALWIGGGIIASFLLYKVWNTAAAIVKDPSGALKATGSAAGKAVVGVGQGTLAAVGVDSNKLGNSIGSTVFDYLHPNPSDTSASALIRAWTGGIVDKAVLSIDGVLTQ